CHWAISPARTGVAAHFPPPAPPPARPTASTAPTAPPTTAAATRPTAADSAAAEKPTPPPDAPGPRSDTLQKRPHLPRHLPPPAAALRRWSKPSPPSAPACARYDTRSAPPAPALPPMTTRSYGRPLPVRRPLHAGEFQRHIQRRRRMRQRPHRNVVYPRFRNGA